MISDKARAKELLLAAAQELTELELEQMAAFYEGGPHPTAGLPAFVFAHTWASIARNSILPLGSLNAEIARGLPTAEHRVLADLSNELAKLDER